MGSKGLRIGIEAKIEYNPILDVLGDKYESIRRTGLNDMQRGMSENEIEKTYQSRFNVQWAWADSIAREVKQTYSQSEASKVYNTMLSNLSTGMFRDALTSRCKRYGIGLHYCNPAFTSVIGMIKFMPRYGLNSATAAAMTIARRAMGMSERAPKCLVRPEHRARHPWTVWNRVARFLKSNKVRRSQLFDWTKTLGKILVISDSNDTGSALSPASSQSNRKEGNSPSPNSKHCTIYVELCLGFK